MLPLRPGRIGRRTGAGFQRLRHEHRRRVAHRLYGPGHRAASEKRPAAVAPSHEGRPSKARREEPAMNDKQKSAQSSTATDRSSEAFSDEERGVMKERAKELTATTRRGSRAGKADEET